MNSATTMQDILQRCAARGCRLTWARCELANAEGGTSVHIEVDHGTTTNSGSEVFVARDFPGDLERQGERLGWTAEQSAAICAWVEQLHNMPLEEIP